MTLPSTAMTVHAVVRANLLRLARDRAALFFLVLLPLLIVFVVGLAFGSGDQVIRIAATAPDTPLAADLLDQLRADDALEVVVADGAEAVRVAVERGDAQGGVVVADGYDAALAAGGQVTVELITDDAEGVGAVVGQAVAGAGAQADARIVALRAAGVDDLAAGLSRLDGVDRSLTVDRRLLAEDAAGLPRGYDATAGQNLILFVFITALAGGVQLIESRRLGVTRRSLAAPVRSGTLLVGESISRFVIAMGQGLVVIVGTVVLFGVEWRNLPVTLLLLAIFALVGAGVAMLLGAVMSNDEQADSLIAPLGIGLGMLGGCMWPLEVVPGWMRAVGHVTPHAWAVDVLNDLQGRGAGLADVAGHLAVLGVAAVLLLAVAGVALRRRLVS